MKNMKLKSLSSAFAIFIFILICGCKDQNKIDELIVDGNAARENENYDQAIEDFSDAIQLDEKSTTALTDRGSIFVITGKFDKAIEDLNHAILLNPNESLAYEMRGYAYFGKSNFSQAISNFNTVIKLDSENGRVFKMRGEAYYAQTNLNRALADLTTALKFSSNDYEIFDNRGAVYYRAHDFEKALNDFSSAIQINSNDTFAFFNRARLYYRNGKYSEAAEDFDTVVVLKPRAERAINLLAWLLATCPDDKIRNGSRALQLAQKACELANWKNYAYMDTLAAAYAETGNFEAAAKYQKQAASMKGIPENNRTNVENRLKLYLQRKPARETE